MHSIVRDIAEHEARLRQFDVDLSEPVVSAAASSAQRPTDAPRAYSAADRSHNPLRPATFAEVIGQERAVTMMSRLVSAAIAGDVPLDHTLLVGAAGTGKSTFSHVIANELGVDCYEVEAPVSMETLLELRGVMRDRDLLRIEEIHQQAAGDRRASSNSTLPEVLYAVMEDRVITTGTGILDYPAITIVGTTTDEGMLPEPFLDRFPIRPVLDAYEMHDIAMMAIWNAEKLGIQITIPAALKLARAARGVPRQVNNYVKNAYSLVGVGGIVADRVAGEVLYDLNGVTADGLTRDMQAMLKFLYQHGRRQKRDETVVYQSSVNTIATAIGKSRDSKAISLRVEPFLIKQGYVQVGHGGRSLTDQGVERARQLLEAP